MKQVKFKEWLCTVEKAAYGNGRPALVLRDAEDGEQVAVATVNLPGVPLNPGEVFIKDYSENEGMLAALVRAGIVEPSGEAVPSGPAGVVRARLMPPFRDPDPIDLSPDRGLAAKVRRDGGNGRSR
jgi:hypothetical protein